jgi:hypothetical protein
MTLRSRRRDERGVALPSPVALLSVAAVVLAGVAFVSTSGAETPTDAGTAAHRPAEHAAAAPTSPAPTKTAPKPVIEKKKADRHKQPSIRRGDTYVEVYNNSGITGLAGETARKISAAGWQVVGSDNWYGTIPESTVYYPERLHAEARLLARDLGITRLHPAISPMRFDRLTVILTSR